MPPSGAKTAPGEVPQRTGPRAETRRLGATCEATPSRGRMPASRARRRRRRPGFGPPAAKGPQAQDRDVAGGGCPTSHAGAPDDIDQLSLAGAPLVMELHATRDANAGRARHQAVAVVTAAADKASRAAAADARGDPDATDYAAGVEEKARKKDREEGEK